jgi:hypothetical protein
MVREWEEYSKPGKKHDDIPALAHRVYKDSGWLGRLARPRKYS